MGKERYVLYSEIAGATVDLFLNVFLIPKFAAAGAAMGTLVAEGVVLFVQLHFLEMREVFYRIPYGKVLAGVMIAAFFSVWVKWVDWGDFIVLAVSGVLYFGVYVIFLYIVKEPLVVEVRRTILRKYLK